MSTPPDQFSAFISYRSTDLALAEQLHARLVAAGFAEREIWFDKARLEPGCDWHRKIEAGCEASRLILCVLTPHWRESEWCRYETYGHSCIIPLLCEGELAEVAPAPLRAWQALDLRHADNAAWETLFRRLREELAQPAPERAERRAHLPFGPPECFVGRDELLLELHEKLHAERTTALTHGPAHVVAGLGGVGKTTVARAYAEKFWRLYQDLLWVNAAGGAEGLTGEFARLALELGVIREPSGDAAADAEAARRALESRVPRLLVIDNAEDEEAVEAWIPRTGECRTLITSRFTGWSNVSTMHVYVLEPGPARELLLRRSERADTEENRAGAERLAAELDHLPLALEQAARYCRRARMGFDRYLTLFVAARRQLLDKREKGATKYPASVWATWRVTVARLHRPARAALILSSFLAPEGIPRFLMDAAEPELREGATELPPTAGETEGPLEESELLVSDALAELAEYSLLSWEGDEGYRVHRLVQAVQRDELSARDYKSWGNRAVEAADRAFPDVEFTNWGKCERLLPHALTVTRWIEAEEVRSQAAGRQLYVCGNYLWERGRYGEAEPLFRRSTAIREGVLASNHPDLATSLNGLAVLLQAQGKLGEAEPLYRRSLAIWEAALGAEHPDVANSLNNLGTLLRAQGKLGEAEPLLRRSQAILEAALGAEHPHVALSLNNHALLLRKLGRFSDAAAFLVRAIAIEDRSLPADHPNRAHRRNNLGLVLTLGDQLEEAGAVTAEAWALKAGQHDLTSARILFSRTAQSWLRGQDAAHFLGQLRTLLAQPELPCLGGIDRRWDAGDVLAHLRARLPADRAHLLAAIVAALNDPEQTGELERHPLWSAAPPVPLESPWPERS